MRILLALSFVAVVFGGCISSSTDNPEPVLDVYAFQLTPRLSVVDGVATGLMVAVSNPTEESVAYGLETEGLLHFDAAVGRNEPVSVALDESDGPVDSTLRSSLAPGASEVWIINVHEFMTVGENGVGVALWFSPVVGNSLTVHGANAVNFNGEKVEATKVTPGMHVETFTVGVWENGTSFYTNSARLLEDPAFPAGGHMDREAAMAGTDALPIYVFEADRSEQPAGSKDTCHFTTIRGYNDLLKSQAESSTGVRYLAPEEAYTRAGAEEHFLYGDALIFLNHVAAIEGMTGPEDVLPQPTGACFNAQNSVPQPPI